MAGTDKITRTVEAVTEVETSKATYLGWELSFNVNKTGGVIQSISLYGTKDGAQVNASRSQDGYTSVGFTNGARDEALYKAILDEFEAISGAGGIKNEIRRTAISTDRNQKRQHQESSIPRLHC